MPACLLLLLGCAHIEDQFRETGPSVDGEWNSPTASDVYARFQPAESRVRAWEVTATQSEDGSVTHGPTYFEDPFEDKGAAALPWKSSCCAPDGGAMGRGPAHRINCADVFAAPYGYARHTLNWLALPVSMVVTPPWTEMVSDGALSEQALGFDHDATRADANPEPRVPPAAAQSNAPNSADANPPGGAAGSSTAEPRMNGLQVIRP